MAALWIILVILVGAVIALFFYSRERPKELQKEIERLRKSIVSEGLNFEQVEHRIESIKEGISEKRKQLKSGKLSGEDLEKYLAGKAGIPTEDRLRAIRLLKDITGWQMGGTEIHAEGSLAAQKMALYSNADWERYKAAAKRAADIPGWQEHPYFGSLPEFQPRLP